MRVAWGRKRELPGRLAAAALPVSLHRMSACVHVLALLQRLSSGFFTLAGALHSHSMLLERKHTHFPLAEKFHLSENVHAFNLQLRRSPGLRTHARTHARTHTHTHRVLGCAEQEETSGELLSQLCVISLSWSKKAKRSPWACSSLLSFWMRPLECFTGLRPSCGSCTDSLFSYVAGSAGCSRSRRLQRL